MAVALEDIGGTLFLSIQVKSGPYNEWEWFQLALQELGGTFKYGVYHSYMAMGTRKC